jgi:hypothetical protein
MRRREFITLLGGAAAWPVAARAQQREPMRRIGALMNLAADDLEAPPRVAAFAQGLQDGLDHRLTRPKHARQCLLIEEQRIRAVGRIARSRHHSSKPRKRNCDSMMLNSHCARSNPARPLLGLLM